MWCRCKTYFSALSIWLQSDNHLSWSGSNCSFAALTLKWNYQKLQYICSLRKKCSKSQITSNAKRTLQWRHNESDGVSNHQPHYCLLKRLFQAQIEESIKTPRHWPLCGEFTGDRWIPCTNGQLRGKCFHLMTSSWVMRKSFPLPNAIADITHEWSYQNLQ